MFSIQCKYVRLNLAGTNSISPLLTALIAGRANGAICTHHCSEIKGSMIAPDRSECPTLWV